MVVHAVVEVDLETFEVGIEDKVHNARDRVRTVHRRSTAGQHIDALDQSSGDEVDVGSRSGRRARRHAAAVDQDQRTLWPETAKVEGGDTACAVGDVTALGSEHLRQRVDEIFHAGRTGEGEFLGGHDGDGAGRFQVRRTQTGAGDDNRLARLFSLCGAIGGNVGILRVGRSGDSQGDDGSCRTSLEKRVLLHGGLPPLGLTKSIYTSNVKGARQNRAGALSDLPNAPCLCAVQTQFARTRPLARRVLRICNSLKLNNRAREPGILSLLPA